VKLMWQALSDMARRNCNVLIVHGPEYWAYRANPLDGTRLWDNS
jgi:hypothetical protein